MTRQERKEILNAQVLASIIANPTTSYIDIGGQFGVSVAYVSVVARANGIFRPKGRASKAWRSKTRLAKQEATNGREAYHPEQTQALVPPDSGIKIPKRRVKGKRVPVGLDLSPMWVWLEDQPDGTFKSVSYLAGIYLACAGNPRYAIVFAKEDVIWQQTAPQSDWRWGIEDYQRKYALASPAVAWERLWSTMKQMYEEGTPEAVGKAAMLNHDIRIHWTTLGHDHNEQNLDNVAPLDTEVANGK